MQVVKLNNLAFFDERRVDRLNNLVAVNKYLMPHLVATGTGCNLSEAMALLLFLHGSKVGAGYLTIYHVRHQDTYFDKIPIQDGFPRDNVFCQMCEENIPNTELLYDFEVILKQDIEFSL